MLGVAGIVVSQTNLVSTPIRGQLVPDGMMSSAGYTEMQEEDTTMTVSSAMPVPAESDGTVSSDDGMQNSTANENAEAENQKWDCDGIRDANEKTCNALEIEGTLLCSDGERDCKDTCTWPVPFNYMCEHSCETARADCEYQLVKKVSACNDRKSGSYSDCLKHNASL